ncbi:MAG: glycosyltransferase family 2 protein [Chitinispirillaceae bacterium]|jgi:undecaprenyl-phosphate 4-deoxy-4-formamido-L-arabinose transferase
MDSTVKPVSLSIVIPVYRSESTIGSIVDVLVNSLKNRYSLEIILVNDCSPDNSEEVCIGLYHKYRTIVKFYSLAKNVGEHNAVMAGLNQSSGEWVVIMDDDLQNPISEVIKLVSYAVEHTYDVIYSDYDKKKHASFRNLGSWFNDKIANVMLKKPKNLYLSSFKVMNRFLVDAVIKYTLPYIYIDGLILRTTSNIGTCKVVHHKRLHGKSGYTVKKLFSLWLNMFTNFSILPLRVATWAGFAFAALGFLSGIETILEKILNPELPVGYAFLIFLITVFAGVQLIAIGMVGEYLGRIFVYQNKTPPYSIRKKFEYVFKSSLNEKND